MRARTIFLSVRTCILLAGLQAAHSMAQTAPGVRLPDEAAATAPGPNERIERIRHEDAGSRIDELRVGGQTRSITVQPKNGAPGYDVAPAKGGEDMSDSGGGSSAVSGRSRWRLLSF